jgi:threonine dehydratase
MIDTLVAGIRLAATRLGPFVRETPVDASPTLSDASGADVVLKLENLQLTGSFKVRGATNRLLTLSDEERRRGVVTASSGNHGLGMAHAGRALGLRVLVFVPQGASPAKLSAIRRLGAEVQFHGVDGLDTEIEARAVARRSGMTYVSPYNDEAVIAGQGTVGVELSRQVPSLDAVIVAVGGGGLISGMAAFLKSVLPDVRVIGAQPQHSAVMEASIRAGRVVDLPSLPTLSDGTAGGIEHGSVTFPLCQVLVDEWVLVPEADIRAAMRQVADAHHFIIEGSAGVAVAALRQTGPTLGGRHVAIVICGSNVSPDVSRSVLCAP